ncbi:MAG: glycosyl hydrolase 115 family protein [Acidobacteriaceae bacterium]|nr:glycosyl hydrolase 115 family protein [Acidobacteriaceae bacterium]
MVRLFVALALCAVLSAPTCRAQSTSPLIQLDRPEYAGPNAFPLAANGAAAAIYVAPGNPETVRVAAEAFANDVALVTGVKPRLLTSLAAPLPENLILVGVLGKSPEIDKLVATHAINADAVAGKWESALTATVASPLPGVRSALVIAGSDRRGAAFALFTLSRQMGVSPWTWWADVPVAHHVAIYVRAGSTLQPEPSVQYRGIFINDEDWGIRPWAAKKMDPSVDHGKGNFGPNTYSRIFELLLRLHANSLWPAMHPGSLAFNAIPENARLADKWGIVMGASHSEALLRNNVGEWDEKRDGPWNYQTNSAAMNSYWDKRLAENGKFENFYTVGLRGVHDSGLEATGSPEVKAKLVEDVVTNQRALLAKRVSPDLAKIPQVIWLYKESLDLYRVGMKVPDDVTLGWTDDNYGYIRELPNAEEQKRSGGSGVYYHVSYWGKPHDYLWLCTTPPSLIREEMTKAYDHNARKYWILNVGDLKPAEMDIDYFMQLAWDEPGTAKLSQHEFLTQWFAEQFPITNSGVHARDSETAVQRTAQSPGAPSMTASSSWIGSRIADVMTRYYDLSFIRKPEFMGFNGYSDAINRTAFNPLAWPSVGGVDQNHARAAAWASLRIEDSAIVKALPQQYVSAYFELVGYPVEAAAAQDEKFLATDRTYLDAHNHNDAALATDTARAHAAYDAVQSLTSYYNSLEKGKWDGMMSADPRERHVFEMPRTATTSDSSAPLPASWAADASTAPASSLAPASGFVEQHATVSINAAHFARKSDGQIARWNVLADLGISGSSVEYGAPGLLANSDRATAASAPWLEYDFTTTTMGDATLALHLLPTFPVDSDHRLRYAVSIDGAAPVELDASAITSKKSKGAGDGPSNTGWDENVLRNAAIAKLPLGSLAPGKHTLRLLYRDPGVVFEHIVVTFDGAPPAYPVPPETIAPGR